MSLQRIHSRAYTYRDVPTSSHVRRPWRACARPCEVCFLALDEDASGHLHRDAFLRFADGLGGPRAGWATANAA